ncbi:MAG: zinc metallopeptidase [Dethiobacteria bacterium]
MLFLGNPIGLMVVIPALLFTLYAQSRVSGAYAKFSRIAAARGFTGAQVASQLLQDAGIDHVRVEQTRGTLTDHYDPRKKVVRLSPQVYGGSSLAAIGIAAHEVGHAIQHDQFFAPLAIRNALFPLASLGSQLAMPLFFIGLFFAGFDFLMDVGIAVFLFAVLFQALTLPVEFNASSRALHLLDEGGFLVGKELAGAKQVLNAAALTYVAAMAVALTQLFRLLILRNSSSRR